MLANASNTYAALPGYVSGVAGYWSSLLKHRDKLLVYSLVSLVFGYVGAELLLRVSDATFSAVVPWLMMFAVLIFAFGGPINRLLAPRTVGRRSAKLPCRAGGCGPLCHKR